MSAAESERDQRRLAHAFHELGMRAGDRVAVAAHNAPEVIAVALAALRSGIVPVMINVDLTDVERQVILDDCDPFVVLDDEGIRSMLATSAGEREIAATPLARPMHYTSGTTGRPKGVWSGVLDDGGGASLMDEERAMWGFRSDDVNIVCSPLYHSAPLRFSSGTLLAGGDVVVLDKFAPGLARAAIAEHGVTSAFMAPAHLYRLFEDGMSESEVRSFRLLAHAGAPCPPPIKQQAVETFPRGTVWEFYGATEGQFTACSTQDWERVPGSVGRARPGRRLEIDAEAGTIWCEVPSYARFAYWRDDAKTAAAWRGDSFSVFDLGRIDENGYLFLDGRRNDLLISGGVNVYPLEIEIALSACPGVRDVAVFGVADERWGQRVCAAVVASANGPIPDVAGFAAGVLAPYKRPKTVVFVDEIPKTPTGKVRRTTLASDLGVS